MKVSHLISDPSEKTFQLQMAAKYFQKNGYPDASCIMVGTLPIYLEIGGLDDLDKFCQIYYDENLDTPWRLLQLHSQSQGGTWSSRYSDFSDIVKLIKKQFPLVESVGSDVLTFVDYLDQGFIELPQRHNFEKLGTELFRLGFTIANPSFNNFYFAKSDQGPGLGWDVVFPGPRHTRSHGVNLVYTNYDQEYGLKIAKHFYPADYLVLNIEEKLRRVKFQTVSPLGRST